MSKYYSFNDFMNSALEEADSICRRRYGLGLDERYSVEKDTSTAISELIKISWQAFIAVAVTFGAGGILFGTAVVAFLATPIGVVIAASLGVAAAYNIKKLYDNRTLPLAVKNIGSEYKERWKAIEGNYSAIDRLVIETAEKIVDQSTISV